MNFGKWIVAAFVFFALFIGTLVTVCVREDISLVSKNYYKEELAYQDQVRRTSNAETLSVKPIIRVTDDKVELTFNTASMPVKGELVLFCPSNAKLDKHFTLGRKDYQAFSIAGMTSGMYKARLSWSNQDRDFYMETIINL